MNIGLYRHHKNMDLMIGIGVLHWVELTRAAIAGSVLEDDDGMIVMQIEVMIHASNRN